MVIGDHYSVNMNIKSYQTCMPITESDHSRIFQNRYRLAIDDIMQSNQITDYVYISSLYFFACITECAIFIIIIITF